MKIDFLLLDKFSLLSFLNVRSIIIKEKIIAAIKKNSFSDMIIIVLD